MKKILSLLFIVAPLIVSAQKGFELKIGGGAEFIGTDPWMNGGLVTGTLFYNVNGIVAIGASFTQGVGNEFFIERSANNYSASLSEASLIGQFTFFRKGKFKFYGDVGVGYVTASVDEPVPDFIGFSTNTLDLEENVVGIGLGAGAMYNIGGGFYWNIFEYRLRTLSSEFLDMDKGFQGSVGPMHALRTGISYAFSSR